MTAIVNNLKDPSWWFSAFFIAILASLIAGLLRDRFEKLISNVFIGLKSWQARREDTRNKAIEALLSDQFYFQIVLFRLVIVVILWSTLFVLYATAPIFLSSTPTTSDVVLWMDRKYFIWQVFTPIFGILTMILSYRVTRFASVAFQAMREYRKRNNLPKLL